MSGLAASLACVIYKAESYIVSVSRPSLDVTLGDTDAVPGREATHEAIHSRAIGDWQGHGSIMHGRCPQLIMKRVL
jgi:hypothetical protein